VKLSIVIPTYNASPWIAQCLDSIRANAPRHAYEVIAVDDNSSDDTLDIVRSQFPDVRVFSNPRNLGFSTTVNVGLRASTGEHIFVLNNDTWVHPGALDALSDYLDATPDAGVVGPKVQNGDGSLQPQCRRFVPSPTGALLYFTGLSRRRYFVTAHDENTTHDVDSLSGAAMLIRRATMEQIGLFDEAFFLYGEDMDYCWRAKLAGWRVVYHPAAVITHFGGQGGTGKRKLNATIEFHRAMWLFGDRPEGGAGGGAERRPARRHARDGEAAVTRYVLPVPFTYSPVNDLRNSDA
jgi:GT2 family glycosyltransferase